MKVNSKVFGIVATVLAVALLFIGFASAATLYGSGSGFSSSYLNQQPSYQNYYSTSDIYTYWPVIGDKETCQSRQDILLQVAPAGCQPSVVRSDLLGEQSVPVFCQVQALQLNPLVNIKGIKNVVFTGKYPSSVSGVAFHPARAAVNTRSALLGDPIVNNIGYVVLVLKKNANESSLPSSIIANLTARVEYDAGNAFGIGRYDFILEEQSDTEWESDKNKQSFLRGNFFVRLERAEADYAIISVYNGDKVISNMRVERGKESSPIYLPGFYCQAGLRLIYDSYEAADKKARIEVSDEKGTETFDVYERSSFLDGKCNVRSIKVDSNNNGNVTISCDRNNLLTLQKQSRGTGFYIGQEVKYNGGSASIKGVNNDGSYIITLADGSERTVTGDKISAVELSADQKKQLSDKAYTKETSDALDDAIAAYEKVADDYPQEKAKSIDKETVAEKALKSAIQLAKDSGKAETEFRLINRMINEYPSADIEFYNERLAYLASIDTNLAGNTIFINNAYKNIRLVDLSVPKKTSKATFSFVEADDKGVNIGTAVQREIDYSTKNLPISNDVTVSLDKINADSATLLITCTKTGKTFTSQGFRLGQPVSLKACEKTFEITLRESDVEKAARVRIIPGVDNARTETNLNVRVGIEKRAIKLNPDKTADKVDTLNESIKKWDSIANNLGKTVTGLKAACLATATFLTAKNFFFGVDGTALARQKVMQDYGWTEKCNDAVRDKTYKSVDECFAKNSVAINQDVKSLAAIYSSENTKIGNYTENSQIDSIFGGKKANYDKVATQYIGNMKTEFATMKPFTTEVDGKQQSVDMAGFTSELKDSDYASGGISYTQAQKMALSAKIVNDDSISIDVREKAKEDLARQINNVNKDLSETRNRAQADASFSQVFVDPSLGFANLVEKPGARQGSWYGGVVGSIKDENLKNQFLFDSGEINSIESENTKLSRVEYDNNNYLVTLGDTLQNGAYPAKNVYLLSPDGKNANIVTDEKVATQVRDAYPSFVKIDASYYLNGYKNPELRYYEIEPYKGVPEVVPIDTREGWYAGVKSDLGLFGAKQNVGASGAVSSFWLCNVGKNGKEEFEKDGFGDDICKRFDSYTGQVLSDFPGISDKNKVNRLVQTAINSIKDAQRQYRSGIRSVNIPGVGAVKVGNPALPVNGANCQDFMTPGDCQAIFNVCDPVVCPSSRCNLGGQFYVPDVIQSGIVGSALLCLPNFGSPSEGGVIIPVCLSGLKAGVDGYVSVLKAHRDCLQENLNTGRLVGICDQIYSVYMCDFFWKQIAPAANVILPRLVEYAYGQGQKTRGGGEYMTVMFAWENARKSIDYFTQSYAVNSFKAFQARNVEEIGSELCKSFISAKSPSSIKNLLEADSPPQFYASFDAMPFSSATVPATSQYKVFYHIFAGKDSGVYYSVYLKNPPEISYYQASGSIQVAGGFISQGQSADETRDFTAPEGYKELCVRINNEEQCGFKQVTSSFAVNYLRDEVVSGQIKEKGIESEEECISGAGALNGELNTAALINTNLQTAAQEAVSPKVYERGIVRVCATDNPASSTNPGRYVQVGACSNDGRVKCWLDTKSVDNALTAGNTGARNETLQALNKINVDNLELDGSLIGLDKAYKETLSIKTDVDRIITEIDSKTIDGVDVAKVNSAVLRIDNLVLNSVDSQQNLVIDDQKVFLNSQKAQLLEMKGKLKEAVARAYLRKIAQASLNSGGSPASAPASETGATSGNSGLFNINKNENGVTQAISAYKVSSDYDSIAELYYWNSEFYARSIGSSESVIKVGALVNDNIVIIKTGVAALKMNSADKVKLLKLDGLKLVKDLQGYSIN